MNFESNWTTTTVIMQTNKLYDHWCSMMMFVLFLANQFETRSPNEPKWQQQQQLGSEIKTTIDIKDISTLANLLMSYNSALKRCVTCVRKLTHWTSLANWDRDRRVEIFCQFQIKILHRMFHWSSPGETWEVAKIDAIVQLLPIQSNWFLIANR